jgi:hypothetical protein
MRGVTAAAGGLPSGSGSRGAAAGAVLPPGPDGATGITDRTVVAAVAHVFLAGGRLSPQGKKVEDPPGHGFDGVKVADSAAVRKGLGRVGGLFFSGDLGRPKKKCGGQEKDQGG